MANKIQVLQTFPTTITSSSFRGSKQEIKFDYDTVIAWMEGVEEQGLDVPSYIKTTMKHILNHLINGKLRLEPSDKSINYCSKKRTETNFEVEHYTRRLIYTIKFQWNRQQRPGMYNPLYSAHPGSLPIAGVVWWYLVYYIGFILFII